jgi:hypothetical protein
MKETTKKNDLNITYFTYKRQFMHITFIKMLFKRKTKANLLDTLSESIGMLKIFKFELMIDL